MSTKSLKKQLMAAIAMVLVAAVALGSSTYAWFITNNQVDATTTNISAQSNAAFMTIEEGTTGALASNETHALTSLHGPIALYPATFGEQDGSTKGKFMTGYGTALGDATLSGDLSLVGTNGTPTEADTKGFAKLEQFNIASRGQDLRDLKVESVTTQTTIAEGQLLETAFRVLITNDDHTKWVVYGLKSDKSGYEIKRSSETSNANPVLYDTVHHETTEDVVNVYVFYEGSDTNIHTNNLQNGKLASSQSVLVTFTATAAEPNT